MSELVLRNRQRVRRVNTPLLRRITQSLLKELIPIEQYELCIHLVSKSEIISLNESFLRHAGATDVITFDHNENASDKINGEIFVCIDEALRQSRRFRTTWQSELVRYIVHGLLHLRGFDDRRVAARRKMKREENRLLNLLTARFRLSRLNRKTRLHQ